MTAVATRLYAAPWHPLSVSSTPHDTSRRDGSTDADDGEVVESFGSFSDALDLGDRNLVQLLDCNKFFENLSVSIFNSH